MRDEAHVRLVDPHPAGVAAGGNSEDDDIWCQASFALKRSVVGYVDQQGTQRRRKLLRRLPYPDDIAAKFAQRQAKRSSHVATAGSQDPRRIAASDFVGPKPRSAQKRAS